MMVGKLTWDAINDPLFGYLSDKTNTLGTTATLDAFAAIPLGISTWLMFSLPENLVGLRHLAVLITFLLLIPFTLP